jgi:3-deoxy-manno-octulosonate cytidylyltransferase (CMP-KDO synthetase)
MTEKKLHSTPPFKVVIPARYGSSRLPGKPLMEIAGKTMIRRVYENALSTNADEVIVAADDKRIIDEITKFGGNAMMTSAEHRSGSDRIAEVAREKKWAADVVIVNLQGDEPAIEASLVDTVALALHRHPAAGIATMATPIGTVPDLFNPNIVKVVCDNGGMALYFSRAPIPWHRDTFQDVFSKGVDAEMLPESHAYLRHLGLYAYRAGALGRIAASPPSPLELTESLEQLRAMSMGIGIHVTTISKAPGHGVDTIEDLQRVNRALSEIR